MSAADFSPLILAMRRKLHHMNQSPFLSADEKRAQKLEIVNEALLEWADDGLRNGHQLDCIVDAARDARA